MLGRPNNTAFRILKSRNPFLKPRTNARFYIHQLTSAGEIPKSGWQDFSLQFFLFLNCSVYQTTVLSLPRAPTARPVRALGKLQAFRAVQTMKNIIVCHRGQQMIAGRSLSHYTNHLGVMNALKGLSCVSDVKVEQPHSRIGDKFTNCTKEKIRVLLQLVFL